MTPTLTAAAGALRRTFRMARRWSASIALLAFQVTPVAVKQTADGKLDIAVGFTAEQYLQESFGCDGVKLADRSVKAGIVSAMINYMPQEDLRVSGYFGSASSSADACSTALDSYCSFPPPFSGAFGGANVAHEGSKLGLGLGIATIPHTVYVEEGYANSRAIRPTFYVRLGNREKKYFRMDVNDVRTPGQVPMTTLGMGFGRKGFNSERGFVGVGFLPYESVGEGIPTVLTGNIAIPVAKTGDILLGGYLGSGESKALTVGGRLHVNGRR